MFSIIQAAGWPIWPLLICSVVALALVFERFYSLADKRIVPKDLLDEAMGDRYISMNVNHRSLEFQEDVLSGIRTMFDQGAQKGLFLPIDLAGHLSP